MDNWKKAFVFATTTTSLAAAVMVYSQQPSTPAGKPAANTASNPVNNITLPRYPPDVAQGPNVEVYSRNCLLCHTARYVSMQPRFPKSVWQSEVKKMIDAYGAVISDGDQTLIIEYLVAVRGVETPPSSPAPPK
jgi:hypothetical protein